MQESYWYFMVQVKASVFYLDIYAEKSYRYDRMINICCAIASSSSIAAWAIWKEWSCLWSLIIALSQVLTVVKDYFPYGRRLKILSSFKEDMQRLYMKMEYEWFEVAQGEMAENDINESLYLLKKEYSEIESRHTKEEILLENTSYMKEAAVKTDLYFQNNF